MSDCFLGEIRIVSFNFAPYGWALCDGQLLSIAQNQALYALLGITFGGDGVTTFALPDFRGRIPMDFGPVNPMGQKAGEETHVLAAGEMPSHTHSVFASTAAPDAPLPTGNVWPSVTQGYASAANAAMNPAALGMAGGQAHENRQPYTVVNFVIALQGYFPVRN